MARRKKNDTFELLWQGLVVLPALVGFSVGFELSHSFDVAGVIAGAGAGIGIATLVIRKISMVGKLKRSGIHEIDKMTGRQFEHFLGHLFKSHGYSVEVTPESGDYGADLILRKDGRKVVVQAKRHSKNIGIKAVQEAQASIAFYKANEAFVVSNRNYTEAAQSLAKSNGVKLINRSTLIDMILKMQQNTSSGPKQAVAAAAPEQKTR